MVVPRTQEPLDRWSRVSTEFLSYYTSGFLTIQHAVDNALLRMTADVAPLDSSNTNVFTGPRAVNINPGPRLMAVPYTSFLSSQLKPRCA